MRAFDVPVWVVVAREGVKSVVSTRCTREPTLTSTSINSSSKNQKRKEEKGLDTDVDTDTHTPNSLKKYTLTPHPTAALTTASCTESPLATLRTFTTMSTPFRTLVSSCSASSGWKEMGMREAPAAVRGWGVGEGEEGVERERERVGTMTREKKGL